MINRLSETIILCHVLGKKAIVFIVFRIIAAVVELADARDSKSRDGDIVWVRPPPAAPPYEIDSFSLILSRFFNLITLKNSN